MVSLIVRQHQVQHLVMTPQLQQALKVLQLGSKELQSLIERELEENPLLEGEDSSEERVGDRSSATALEELAARETVDRSAPARHYRDAPDCSSLPAAEQGLCERVLRDAMEMEIDPSTRRAIVQIAGNLDARGYLDAALDEVAAAAMVPLAVAEEALRIVQSLEPAGIGARSLTECLMLQLERKGQADSLAARIIQSHSGLLERGRFSAIARAEHASNEDVREALLALRKLDPSPGGSVLPGAQPIIPDVTVIEWNGHLEVALNDGAAPRVRLSPSASALEASGVSGEYLKERRSAASALLKAIDHRHSTLLEVARAIVSRQCEFFLHGPEYLKPLALQAIADDVGVNPSTVSRAIANKYMECARGVFPMKYFFGGALRASAGSAASKAVKSQIAALFDACTSAGELSDQRVAEILRERGITIARRTVSKYRKAIGIKAKTARVEQAIVGMR